MISAIICEYNPLHNGHIYLIEQTRKYMNLLSNSTRNFIIAVMSGNFTERGEISVLNKYTRAKLALECGVDMVVELPSIYATSSATLFAKGAMEIINNIRNIDFISFGSESGNIDKIKNIAAIQESDAFNSLLKQFSKQGNSYPVSADLAMNTLNCTDFDSISSPNDVLGIEYYKQAVQYGLSDKLICFKRLGRGYNDDSIAANFSSSTAIRKAINENSLINIENNVPENVYTKLIKSKVDYEKLLAIIAYQSLTEINVYEDNEGIINRIRKYAPHSQNYEEFINLTHTKRYTKSKIKRVALHLCLKHNAQMTNFNNIKVLGVRKDSTALLSIIDKSCASEIIKNNDIFANAIYNIVSEDKIELDKMLLV